MKMNKAVAFVLCFIAALISMSCSAAITVTAANDGSIKAVCNAALGQAFMDVMRQMNGTAPDSPLMTAEDCKDMAARLMAAGLNDSAVRTPARDSVEVAGKAFLQGKALPDLLTGTKCIAVSAAKGKRRLTLALNKTTLGALYGRLDEEVQSYLDLSMAGVFGGESMTAEEWISALEVVYGKPFADEASRAQVKITMSVEGRNAGDVTVRTFTVPLADILAGKGALCEAEG